MSSGKATILAVDDDVRILRMMKRTLELEGYQVLAANSGEAALDVMDRETPCLVLLDIRMPGMDGYTICLRIREFSQIPIIMVTALNEFGDIQRAIDSGSDDFVSKPVNKLELLTRVRTMLKLKHLSDKLERTLAYLSEVEKQAQAAVLGIVGKNIKDDARVLDGTVFIKKLGPDASHLRVQEQHL